MQHSTYLAHPSQAAQHSQTRQSRLARPRHQLGMSSYAITGPVFVCIGARTPRYSPARRQVRIGAANDALLARPPPLSAYWLHTGCALARCCCTDAHHRCGVRATHCFVLFHILTSLSLLHSKVLAMRGCANVRFWVPMWWRVVKR